MHFQAIVFVLTIGYLVDCQIPVYPLVPLNGAPYFKPSGLNNNNVENRSPDDHYTANRQQWGLKKVEYEAPQSQPRKIEYEAPQSQPTKLEYDAPQLQPKKLEYDAPQLQPPISDEDKGRFVQSDGVKYSCQKHMECYPYREPQQWCHLASGEFWIDKGCYCDKIEGACIIKRRRSQDLQWTYCSPKNNWVCP